MNDTVIVDVVLKIDILTYGGGATIFALGPDGPDIPQLQPTSPLPVSQRAHPMRLPPCMRIYHEDLGRIPAAKLRLFDIGSFGRVWLGIADGDGLGCSGVIDQGIGAVESLGISVTSSPSVTSTHSPSSRGLRQSTANIVPSSRPLPMRTSPPHIRGHLLSTSRVLFLTAHAEPQVAGHLDPYSMVKLRSFTIALTTPSPWSSITPASHSPPQSLNIPESIHVFSLVPVFMAIATTNGWKV
ncbi:hypothetical protein Hypma_006982 [Hypsizygus marmoreus]|uniref:Uncharacterized protein n=1 Tax=Hypsizygus marmoreus TaxID=39966 RepID=A0A369KFQ7_HYPMA|nr:hypothetical protein Hypma_006982 [Hypsizygus marmoreus]